MLRILIFLTFFAYSGEARILNDKDLMLSHGPLESSKKVFSIDELIKDYQPNFFDEHKDPTYEEVLEKCWSLIWTASTMIPFLLDVTRTSYGFKNKKVELTNGREYNLGFHYLPNYVPDYVSNNVPKRTDGSIYHANLRIRGTGEKAGQDFSTLTDWFGIEDNQRKAFRVLFERRLWDILDENVSITKLDNGVRFEWALEVPDQLVQRTPQPFFNIELTIGTCPKP